MANKADIMYGLGRGELCILKPMSKMVSLPWPELISELIPDKRLGILKN